MVWGLIVADRGTQTLTGCPRLRGVVRMTTLDLEPIKERLDKAHTEWGPWKAKEDSWDGYSVVIDDSGPGVSIIAEQIGQGEDEGRGDAEFIANAPEDIAALISEVERLRGQVNAVKKIIRSPGITTVKGSPADRIMRALEVRK